MRRLVERRARENQLLRHNRVPPHVPQGVASVQAAAFRWGCCLRLQVGAVGSSAQAKTALIGPLLIKVRPSLLPLSERVTQFCTVLDPRTRQILFKMVNKGFVDHVHGAISTGKEANVYHATRNNPTGDDEADVAIKVYKTSILVFKDREQYISGDYRYSM
jgi:hypothetical protein